MIKLMNKLTQKRGKGFRGQSFLELALVLPVLILILMGLVEVAFFLGRYLDALDLTREAARFASIRDPFVGTSGDNDCATQNSFDFYWDSSCIFSPPPDDPRCSGNPAWCGGMDKYLDYNPDTDDVVITVFSWQAGIDASTGLPYPLKSIMKQNEEKIIEGADTSYYWAFSNHKTGAYVETNNWKNDCQGNTIANAKPFYTLPKVRTLTTYTPSEFPADVTPVAAPRNIGFVAVEVYVCHDQVLALPIFTAFVPNPIKIHAYTLMPLPAAQPTAIP